MHPRYPAGMSALLRPLSFGLLLTSIACTAGQKSDLDSGGSAGTPEMGLVADFSLEDLNPGSVRAGEAVSPRDYLERVSGWYFIHAT